MVKAMQFYDIFSYTMYAINASYYQATYFQHKSGIMLKLMGFYFSALILSQPLHQVPADTLIAAETSKYRRTLNNMV